MMEAHRRTVLRERCVALVALAALGLLAGCRAAEEPAPTVLSAPCGSRYTGIDRDGTTVLPNGRFVRPRGRSVTVAPHPFGLALSRTGELAITANSGTEPLSISIIENLTSASPTVRAVPPGPTTDEGVLASVFMGLAISPDERTVCVAGGQENEALEVATGGRGRLALGPGTQAESGAEDDGSGHAAHGASGFVSGAGILASTRN